MYRPWVNKGKRRSKTLQNNVGKLSPRINYLLLLTILSPRTARKYCRASVSGPPSRRSTYRIGEATDHLSGILQRLQTVWVSEPDKHYGERCASPERQFKCEGWCRTMIPRRSTLEHPDVVRWASDNPSILSHLHPPSRRYPSLLQMMVKSLGMQVNPTATVFQ